MTAHRPLNWAFESRPLPTEVESGDRCIVVPRSGGALLAVIDGLGHGPEAAAASRVAANTLSRLADGDPADLITQCHVALRGTRGAAMLIVGLSFREARFAWAGVGNVEGWHVRAAKRDALVSKAGVVGYQISAPLRREAELAPGDLFLLATDGILPEFVGGLQYGWEPDAIAGAVLREYGRISDDALILVARYEGGPAS
jgi:negative regulator of sigma-B (phosphoserine phosphatase)